MLRKIPAVSASALVYAVLLVTTGCASLPGVYKLPSASAPLNAPATSGDAPAAPRGGTGAAVGAATPGGVAALTPAAAPPSVSIGAQAPDAAFFAQDGKRHTLSEYKGKFLAPRAPR